MYLRMFSNADAGEARRYGIGQCEAYATHGVEAVADEHWLNAPPGSVFAAATYDSAGAMVGGIRVHLRRPRLPIERYLGDPRMEARVERHAKESPAELCGLWALPSWRGTGLADFVFMGGLAVCRAIGADWVCGSSHLKMVPLFEKYGTRFDQSRAYAYPDARYTTYVFYADPHWPDSPQHPAREAYRMMRAAFREGRAFHFEASTALAWKSPLSRDFSPAAAAAVG